ncbi:MAG TPA: hypothetical protein DDW84_04080 [Phycisphaerales bacterium]|nr:MAG: hypothetical protein A2Y13_04850 [Planctomycetes bacterium GWC2_45_44]HBG78015.1 hypothetical protein [Phycisphaerales bacterium]HBR18692.1 hypothetical protein [Phycisphaerales bacterium]
MNICKTDIRNEIFRFAKDAFEAFCVDIETMFGIEVRCQPREQQSLTGENLKKHFRTFCAVNTIEAHGAIDGSFYLMLDPEALFTLAGIFVVLPDNKILENRKSGTERQAFEISSVIEDAGNLLAGAFDRVFRENVETHRHFLPAGTFISSQWRDIQQKFDIKEDAALTVCFYELTAGNLPPFSCCAVFPETIFAKAAEPERVGQADSVQAQSEPLQPPQQTVEAAATPDSNNIFSILGLKAVDVMNNDVKWCRPDCPVEKAIEQMRQTGVEYLLVGSKRKTQGVVAMSDLSSAVSIYLQPMFAKWKRPLDEATLKIKVQCVMSSPAGTIPPETTFEVVVEKLVRQNGCLVVVDAGGKTLGTITAKDCLAGLLV